MAKIVKSNDKDCHDEFCMRERTPPGRRAPRPHPNAPPSSLGQPPGHQRGKENLNNFFLVDSKRYFFLDLNLT
ncbi:hypothetical protein [Roseibium salinum]|uniref:Uncharacterized protein n=1 Tax=Roseibium salinum TaxID=1604349 RepID=A0ABT3QX61_9HYPH|nr:hypothetical protein [Roseibium sp. DSM 29163]MCX2721514.1 hypothetical protein [Roseibium sp. DSM 29163]